MNKGAGYTIGIIAVVAIVIVVAAYLAMSRGTETGPGTTGPSLETSAAENSASTAESTLGGFVDEATPAPTQEVPGLS